MAFGWLKRLFGKSGNNGNGGQIDTVHENPFFESGENEAVNPFFQDLDNDTSVANHTASMHSNAEAVRDVANVATSIIEPGNLMTNIAGMPTRASIEMMAGGLKMEKIGKHKNVAMALNALERYQEIMEQPHEVHVDAKKIAMENKTYNENGEDKMFDASAADDAFEALGEFVVYANKVINDSNGLFAGRSSNIQKLVPVFANLITQASGLLPKLSHLETAVAPYVISTDKMSFTFSELISSNVTGNRSGGLATRGIEANNGSIDLSPEDVIKTLNNEELNNTQKIDEIREQRRQRTKQSRMWLKIPSVPLGILKDRRAAAVTEEQIQEANRSAEAMTDAYFAELRPLLTALEDTAESYEGVGKNERDAVHGEQARHFWTVRFLQRIMQNRDLFKNVLLNGLPENNGAEYKDIEMLYQLGGRSLSTASQFLQEEAMNPNNFAKLTDEEGNALEENAKGGYKIDGGNASIAILDFHNKKVLRSPKKQDGYLSQEEQKTAFNGIHDEAVAKVGQFLGFNVMANAKAGGFMAKEKGKSEETPVFGGSVMDFAKGQEASKINLLFGGESKKDVVQRRQGDAYKNVDISKNGRLIEDLMKMSIVDYITLHADRHGGNFLINADAAKGESMVTGIDNDMVFGHNDASNETGFHNSATAIKSVNQNVTMQYGASVSAVLPMVTESIKTSIENLDIEQFDQMLMPYVDRVGRMAAVHRAQELKEYVKTAEVCDLSTPEGVMEYLNKSNKKAVEEWTKGMYLQGKDIENAIFDTIKTPLLRMLLESHGAFKMTFGSAAQTVFAMKIAGFSKQEAEATLLNNVSASKGESTRITKEQLDATGYKSVFEDYDLPMNEFRTKYKFV